MAFFPRTIHNHQDQSFTPLFRLLDDFDTYSRQQNPKANRHCLVRQWQPKFDVRETTDAYELHGELPGVNKDNVNIEFSEPQTLVIRGKVERSYTAGTPPAGQVEDSAMSGGLSSAAEEPKTTRRATVEDEEDEEWSNASHSRPGTPTTTTAEIDKQPEPEEKKVADKAKYWLKERSVGEFSRSFNFPNRVDQDGVTANFKDGILSIVVPKAKKHESRRIAIN
ncbi:hypothetical protein J3458_003434 [Metarhizium acridum]|uniref:Heat shock protein 30 n=1 Tax=Metarhizium acridum (strain CQMa 102) TaxID=655827 RepID=E9E2W9_METAQ|nr:heat shock protein 30 [Metarhizium acridum CQMa 102]EFY89785.1 heat shock protein 30 [Metarhizium acridum CQMa 102]KAG8421564.1 hypothetical protein J3458_003434 [Metarhizium acridum]